VQQGGDEQGPDRDAAEDRGALDRVGDLLEFGLGKLDVGVQQALRGVSG
jgi:hypothetical protein